MGLGRVELPTSRLSGVRSNHLSYRPGWKRASKKKKEKRRRRRPALVQRTEVIPNLDPVCSKKIGTTCTCRVVKLIEVCKSGSFLRKEVIQPQVPLRLPCYDFTPVADLTVAGCLLAVSAPSSGKTNSHGVTGGVYKARERIHRGMLIRDY